MGPKKGGKTKKGSAKKAPPKTPDSANTRSQRGSGSSRMKRKANDSEPETPSKTTNTPTKTKTSVRQSKNNSVWLPGKRSEPSSFISIPDNEATVAAYLGYDDVADFRLFLMSPTFLEWFSEFYRDGKWHNQLRVFETLVWIRDRYLDDNIGDFPTEKDTIGKYYPATDREQKAKHLAHILIAMVHDLEALRSEDSDVKIDGAKQSRLVQKLMTKTGLKGVSYKATPDAEEAAGDNVPELDGRSCKLPQLITQHEETDLEAYNRAWMLLKHFQGVCSSASKYPKRFTNDVWADKVTVAEDYVPHWMRDTISASTPSLPTRKVLPRLVITLKWEKSKGPKADREALQEHLDALENEGVTIPALARTASGDPRVHSAQQFRDSIRADFKCPELQLQLSRAILHIPVRQSSGDAGEDDGDGEQEIELMGHVNWDWVKAQVESAFPTDTANPHLTVSVRFRKLDTANDEDLMESTLPPPQLENILEIVGDDVVTADTNEAEIGDGDNVEVEPEDFLRFVQKQPQRYELKLDTSDMAALREHFDGMDVTKPTEKVAWQRKVLDRVTAEPASHTGQEQKRKVPKDMSKEARRAYEKIEGSLREGTFAAMADTGTERHADAKDNDKQLRYYRIQGAFTGTEAQKGPDLSPCLLVLGMRPTAKAKATDPTMYECTLLDGVKRTFFAYQVTCAVFILVRLLGTIPLPAEHASKPEVQKALSTLKGLQTFGCINADYTGLGKTIETLLALAWISQYHDEPDGFFKPMLTAVPAAAVSSWSREIANHWPCFELAISFEKEALDTVLQGRVLTSPTMKELPDERKGLSAPKKGSARVDFSWLFDETDARNKNCIVLTSHDTHAERFVYAATYYQEPESYKPPRYNAHDVEILKEGFEYEVYETKMEGAFLLTVFDEAHAIKNVDTKVFAGAYLMKAKYNILVTATPMQNTASDMIGLLVVLFQQIQEKIAADDKLSKFAKTVGLGWRKAFDGVSPGTGDANDPRRLILLDPKRVAGLLRTNNPKLISENFHWIDDLITIRRSAATKLDLGNDGGTTALRDMMKPHKIKTLTLNRTGEQERTYQWMHKEAAGRYVKELRGSGEDRSDLHLPVNAGGRMKRAKTKPDHFVYPVVPLRDLDIANASTHLGRFNLQMKKGKHNTLVAQMEKWRREGMTAEDFIEFTRRDGDPAVKTRGDYIQVLCDGSPIFLAICRKIKKLVLEGKKLLLVEHVPLVAWFWELAIQLLQIEVTTMHSGLDQKARTKIADDFNRPGGLMVLTIMFDVGGQAINLQKQCHNVFVCHPGISMAKLLQAIGRVIRVDQENEVTVDCAFIANSHSRWRIYRQSSKVMIELATRASDPDVRELLVELLQSHQSQVEEARESEAGKIALEFLQYDETAGQERPTAVMAGTFNDTSARSNDELLQAAESIQAQTGGTDVAEKQTGYMANRGLARKRTQTKFLINEWGSKVQSDSQIKNPGQRVRKGKSAQSKSTGKTAATKKAGPKKLFTGPFIEETDEEEDDQGEDEAAIDSSGEYDDGDGAADDASDDEDDYANEEKARDEGELMEVRFTDEMDHLMALVKLPPDHVYTDDDLDDPSILRRGLLLLYRERLGQEVFVEASSIHINYNLLPRGVEKAMQKAAVGSQRDALLVAEAFGKQQASRRASQSAKAKKTTAATKVRRNNVVKKQRLQIAAAPEVTAVQEIDVSELRLYKDLRPLGMELEEEELKKFFTGRGMEDELADELLGTMGLFYPEPAERCCQELLALSSTQVEHFFRAVWDIEHAPGLAEGADEEKDNALEAADEEDDDEMDDGEADEGEGEVHEGKMDEGEMDEAEVDERMSDVERTEEEEEEEDEEDERVFKFEREETIFE